MTENLNSSVFKRTLGNLTSFWTGSTLALALACTMERPSPGRAAQRRGTSTFWKSSAEIAFVFFSLRHKNPILAPEKNRVGGVESRTRPKNNELTRNFGEKSRNSNLEPTISNSFFVSPSTRSTSRRKCWASSPASRTSWSSIPSGSTSELSLVNLGPLFYQCHFLM